MHLVAEPKNGEAEDDFRPDAHALFFAPQEFAHVPNVPQAPSPPPTAPVAHFLSQPMESVQSRDGLLSPYCSNGSFFASSHGSTSSASSPVPSSACSTRAVSPYYPMPTPGTENMTNQVFQLNLNPPSPAMRSLQASYSNEHATPVAPVMAPLPPQYVLPSAEEGGSNVPTPRISPSKLGHRRAASKGLSLTIPRNTFNDSGLQSASGLAPGQQESASNPTTPWPQRMVSPLASDGRQCPNRRSGCSTLLSTHLLRHTCSPLPLRRGVSSKSGLATLPTGTRPRLLWNATSSTSSLLPSVPASLSRTLLLEVLRHRSSAAIPRRTALLPRRTSGISAQLSHTL